MLPWTLFARSPVSQIDDAPAERACLDELQVDLLIEGREEGRAAAQDDRVDEGPELVDQAEFHQAGGEPCAADGEILARPLLQPCDLLAWAVPDQASIAHYRLERPREHDLRQLLPDAGELALGLRKGGLLLRRLPVDHRLVESPPQKVPTQLTHLLGVEPKQLVVRHRPVDLAARPG